MDVLYQQVRGDNFSNWLHVAVGISATTQGISDYLKGTLLSLHHTIKYGPCAQLPNCTQKCSITERNLSSWCPTCKEWKKQIMLYNRYKTRARQIKWSNINSAEWPQNVNEMVKVFAPDWWKATTPYTEDIVVALHVFHNCSEFNIPILIRNRVREIRNDLFAHRQLHVYDDEKKRAFKSLIAFLKLPEISKTESGKIAISQLKRLKSNCVLKLSTEEDTFKHHLVKVLNPENVAERTLLDQSHDVNAIRIGLREDKSNDRKSVHSVLVIGICMLIIACVNNWSDTSDTGLNEEKDCLSLTFSEPCPWDPDFNFDGYLKDRPVLFGREWLVDKIRTSLIGTPSRGIMLTAEMGYGKSTLVSHMLCSAKLPESNGLRKFILSYHICKFDVISTQRPEYFIKNLAGMLISKLPEAGNAILTNKLAMSFLLTSKCSADPIGCIDASIIHPLRGLKFDEERYVIVDAIDECGDSAAIAISLLDVLSKRINNMPWWLKLFITTRDINMVTDRFSGMIIIHETPDNIQNQNDIAAFLSKNLFIHNTTLSRLFGTHTDLEEVTKRILRTSGSNFLYVELAVKFWIGSPHSKFNDMPQSLSELYHANLDRVFGDNPRLYDLARKVFEVLCTSYKQLRLEELEAILNVSKHPYDLRSLLGNQISHFVENKNQYISIYHKGMCDYLSDTSVFNKYYISKYTGHKLFASYLLSKYNISRTDTIEMFIHVAESNDLDLLHSFQHSKHVLKMNFSSGNHLYQMARTKNSFLGTKLLIKVLGKEHINNVTSANVTATFLAAAFGHSETLRALIEEGGDYFFRVPGPPNKGGLEDAVSYCKYKTLWGYGLLDIASQNGHSDVVDLLLSQNQTLLYFKNGLSLNAVHLASEHGHTDILDKFLAINSTLADQHSLYLAAKNGHLVTVLSLLQHGVKDTCVPCEDKIHWVTNNTKRMQWHPCSNISESAKCDRSLLLQYDELENVTFVLNDDERLIKCTTALEIAIQRGYKDIVFHLLSQATNALHCREYGGRTPLLTAIKYNQSEILDIILENGGNIDEKCEHVHNSTVRISPQMFNYNEKISLLKDMCPLGSGFEHILAMSGRKEIFKHLHSRGKTFNWTLKDVSGNTPLHYAACNNEWEMIKYMIYLGNVNIYIAATNGSLAIHSAVLCNAIMSYLALRPDYAKSSRELIDNEGRGLLHYLSLTSEYTKNITYMLYLLTTDTYRLKTSTNDNNSSNYLHYAAEIGNHQSILHFGFQSNASLILQANKMNETVLDVAFENLPHQDEYRLCVNCSYVDLFKKQQKLEYDEILPKEEITVYRLFQVISVNSDMQQAVDYPKYHRLAVMKGNTFIVYSIIMFQPRPLIVPVDKRLLAAFLSAEQPSIGMLHLLSQFTSDYCFKPFEESLLHRAIRNENNKFWIYWVRGCEFVNVLNQKPVSFWDTCYDRDGYNILHHAIMGGNYEAVKYLVKRGVALSNPPLSTSIDLISLGLSHADIYVIDHIKSRPSMEYRESYIDKGKSLLKVVYFENDFYSSTKNFDNATSYLLSELLKGGNSKFSDFCKTKSKHLSLVHRAAIKGHLYFLMTLYKAFGKRVLQCRNTYQFTPLYFAKIFDHLDVIKFLKRKSVTEVFPDRMAEFVFLQKFAADNDSELRNVPAYVNLIVRLTHPYLYHMKPMYQAINRRTLMRLCFEFDVIATESFAEMKNYYKIQGKTTMSMVIEILIKTVIINKKILCHCHKVSRPIVDPSLFVKTNASGLLTLVQKQIRTIYLIFERQNLINIVSSFHETRIGHMLKEMRNMSFQTLKDFHSFRRNFLDDKSTDYFPCKSELFSFRFHIAGIKSLEILDHHLTNVRVVDPRSKILNKFEPTSFPLHVD